MKLWPYLPVLIMPICSHGQMKWSDPVSLTGYEDGIRTVHFTKDNEFLIGDFGDIVKWRLSDGKLISKTAIPGYSTNESVWNGFDIWVQGNVNYNSEKQDIAATHPNLNIWNGLAVTSRKTERVYQNGALIPSTRDVILITTDKTYKYEVVRIGLDDLKEQTVYFSEKVHGSAVPTEVSVSRDGSFVAIATAGEKKGIWVFRVSDGKLVGYVKTYDDAGGVVFTPDGKHVLTVSDERLMGISLPMLTQEIALPVPAGARIKAVSSTGKAAVLISKEGVHLMDYKTSEIKKIYTGQVWDAAFSRGDKYLALGLKKTLHDKAAASVVLFSNPEYREEVTATDEDDNPGLKAEVKMVDDTPGLTSEWKKYSYATGGFSIDLPVKPKEKEPEQGVKGPYFLQLQASSQNIGFLVDVRELTEDIPANKTKKYLQSMGKTVAEKMGARIVSSKWIDYNGVTTLEQIYEKEGLSYKSRYFRKGTKSYSMVFVNDVPEHAAQRERFFLSFRFI